MDDWTTLVKNAVAVLVILLAISVVLFLGYLGLNAANAGGEKLSGTTSTMDARSFDQYNQTTLSGAIALNGVKNYANSALAVVVNTLRDPGDKTANYGACLADETTEDIYSVDMMAYDTAALAPKFIGEVQTNVERVVTNQFLFTDNKNTNTVRATTKADAHYINPTAKFLSVLIYDINDDIVGIYMEQQITRATYKAMKDSTTGRQWDATDFRLQDLDSWASDASD